MHVTSFPRRFLDPKKLCHEARRLHFDAPKTAPINLKNRHDTPGHPQKVFQTLQDVLKHLQEAQDDSRRLPQTIRTVPNPFQTLSTSFIFWRVGLQARPDTLTTLSQKHGLALSCNALIPQDTCVCQPDQSVASAHLAFLSCIPAKSFSSRM